MTGKQRFSAFIGLGSNIGDRASFLQKSIELIDLHPDIEVIRRSNIYETAPVGYIEQDAFLNMVILLKTTMTAQRLFAHMLHVEHVLERKRDIRWGPRTIDLDLLLYNGEQWQSEDLIIPHPRMLERAFVMIPLMDVLGDELIPGINSTVDVLEQLNGKEDVKLWESVKLRGNQKYH